MVSTIIADPVLTLIIKYNTIENSFKQNSLWSKKIKSINT